MPVSSYKISVKRKHKRLLKRLRSTCILVLFYTFIKHVEHWDEDHDHEYGNVPRLDQQRPSYNHDHKRPSSNQKRNFPEDDAWNSKITINKQNYAKTTTEPVVHESKLGSRDFLENHHFDKPLNSMNVVQASSIISKNVKTRSFEKQNRNARDLLKESRMSEVGEHLQDLEQKEHLEAAEPAFLLENYNSEENHDSKSAAKNSFEIDESALEQNVPIAGFTREEIEAMGYADLAPERVTKPPSKHLSNYRRKREKIKNQHEAWLDRNNKTKVDGNESYNNKKSAQDLQWAKDESNSQKNFWEENEKSDKIDLKSINFGDNACTPVRRYAEKQKSVLGLPPAGRWELGAYPAFLDSHFVTPKLDFGKEKYDAMCHHSRHHKAKLDAVTYDDKKVFTVLRDPVDNFESNFGFFRDYPYKQWLGDDYLKKFEIFVSNPGFYYDKSTPWYFRAKNYQSYDLGLDNDNESPGYIANSIDNLENQIDLVMITELIDESLLLLRQLLCMDIDDIVYLKLKIRKDSDRQEQSTLSEPIKSKIRHWNELDYSLYKHFKQKLEEKIMVYGSERMKRDTETLQRKLKEVEGHCVERYEGFPEKPWISRLILKSRADSKCFKMSQGEVQLGDEVRVKQAKYVKTIRSVSQDSTPKLVHELRVVQRGILGEDVKFV